MSVYLSPVFGAAGQLFDDNGNPLAGGKIYTYLAGTTTNAATFTTSAGNIQHSNPILLDGAGRVPSGQIWITDGVSYKFVIEDSNNALIGTYDNIFNVTQITDSEDIFYTPPFANSVTTTVEAKLGQTISIKDFGAVCNGVTDDTTEVQTAITTIGSTLTTLIIPGPTKISGNLTFAPNTQLLFQNGGKFVGTSGSEVVTLQSSPMAGVQQIFQNCDPYFTTGVSVFPEWFGAVKNGSTSDLAAFTSAIRALRNVGGIIQLQSGFYATADQITINCDDITIQGAGNNVSWIKVTGTNKNGIKIDGTAGVIRNVMLRDFSIILATPATALCIGLNLYFTAFPIIERMQIHDFLLGVRMEGATNSQVTKIGSTYTGATNNFIGFAIYGGASGATSANASSILRDCYSSGVAGLTGQIGFYVYGSYMSDVQFDTCETALTNYGYSIDYSLAPNFNVDIIIRNPIIDRYFTQGILVNGLPSNGALQIIGGYTNPDTLGAAAQNMYFDTCVGTINIIGHEFIAPTNNAFTDGIFATASNGITIANNLFTTLNKGVKMTNCGYSVINGNVFRGGNPSSFAKMVEIIGGLRVMVSNNSFSGATEAVTIDATSDGCGIIGNTANVATVGTRFTNNGTNPVGGANGSTGLNSGI